MAAYAAILFGLIVVWFTMDPLATDSPGRAAEVSAQGADDPSCLLGIRNATIHLDRHFVEKLNMSGVRVSAAKPAAASSSGNALTIPVRGASGVTCLARDGVIGLRGGVTFADADEELMMRKWRVILRQDRVETFLASGSSIPIAAFRVDLSRAERVVRGQGLSLNSDVRLGDGGLAALNLTFGTEFEVGQRVGRLRLGVREIRREIEQPVAPEPERGPVTGPRVSLLG